MAAWSVPGVVHLREVREDPVGRRVVARHHITRRSLAVTYLSDELLADTEFRTRFARECGRLTRVRDSRVAGVHRYVECHQGAAVIGDPVHGTSLRDLLRTHGAISTEAALVVLTDSLRGLAACHATGLAHGDIKPEDVIVTPSGRVRLVDAGLWTASGRRLLARSTPFYLAPEQWNGPLASPAGDLYAATVTFFECLVGAPPFYSDHVAELSAKHEQNTPPIDAISGPVRELVRSGLTKDPRRRPEVRSLLADVVAVAAHSLGAGWEQRGRHELARLLTNQPALPEIVARDRGRHRAGCERPRLAAVLGGALVLAAGLASPPLAVILPGDIIVGSDARPPVRAFPEPAPDTSPVRAVTKGPLQSAPAAKAAPVRQPPAARARPDKEHRLAPSVPGLNPRIARGEYPHPSVQMAEAARARSAPERACTPMWMAQHRPCSAPAPDERTPWTAGPAPGMVPAEMPSSIELPSLIEVPVSIPVLGQGRHRKDVQSPEDVQFPEDLQPRGNVQPLSSRPPKNVSKDVEPLKEFPSRTASRGWEQVASAGQAERQWPDTGNTGESTVEQSAGGKHRR